MKKALIILTVALMVQCTIRTPGKSLENSSGQADTTEYPDKSALLQSKGNYSGAADTTEHPDKSRRWVFYSVFPKPDGYRVSKSLYLIILDERMLFIEIGQEPETFRIKDISYMGDSIIAIQTDRQNFIPWSDYRRNKEVSWHEIYQKGKEHLKLTKNVKTKIWTVHAEEDNGIDISKLTFIETRDILPSGYEYQNRRIRRHNPDFEGFDDTGVLEDFDASGTNANISYRPNDKPYEATWMRIIKGDTGYVVPNYPSLMDDDRETKSPEKIIVGNDRFIIWTISGQKDVLQLENVKFDGGVYYFSFTNIYKFQMIDEKAHVAKWSRVYNNTGLTSEHYYVDSTYNTYPIIDYEWD